MESVHVRLPDLLLRQVDRWAEERGKDRSETIRELLSQAMDMAGITYTVDRAIRESLARRDWSPSQRQVAELGASLSYAVMSGLGKSPVEIAQVVKQVREALEEG